MAENNNPSSQSSDNQDTDEIAFGVQDSLSKMVKVSPKRQQRKWTDIIHSAFYEVPANEGARVLNKKHFLDKMEELAKMEGADKAPKPPIRNLAAQGGGAKGAAYIGVLRGIEDCGELDNIKNVAGASAGAINAFMIGLGLNAQQMSRLSNSFNFQDFLDFNPSVLGASAGGMRAVQVGGLLTKGYVHKGQNFHDWASALLENVLGEGVNPDITFAEYAELCKKNPALKNMIFKATKLTSNGAEEHTFSLATSPHVCLIDALRASMSFPGAFEPWQIRAKVPVNDQKKPVVYQKDADGKMAYKSMGTYADGGLLNNFPIDVFDDEEFEDEHYHLVKPKAESNKLKREQQKEKNPTSVGLSLTKLKNLDEAVTPLTPELKARKYRENEETVPGEKESIEEELAMDYYHVPLIQAVKDHKMGRHVKINPEDVTQKHRDYKGQVVQIFPEGVDTLEFDLSQTKKAKVEKSGEAAWKLWHAKERDPRLVYDGPPPEFKVNLESKEVIIEQFKEYFMEIAKENEARMHHQNADYQEVKNNQRIKFYAHLVKVLKDKVGDSTKFNAEELISQAYDESVLELEMFKKNRQAHDKRIQAMLDNHSLSMQIETLLHGDKASQEKALRLIKGKLGSVFEFFDEHRSINRNTILDNALMSGNKAVVEALIHTLTLSWNMLYQQGREPEFSISDLLNDHSRFSLYRYAFESRNPMEMMGILLRNEVDPIALDVNGKNAFHYAIDSGNYQALEALLKWAKSKGLSPTMMHFGRDRNTLGHYIVSECNENQKRLLEEMLKHPKLVKDFGIFNNTPNDNAVTSLELAARLHFSDKPDISDMKVILASKGEIVPSSDEGKIKLGIISDEYDKKAGIAVKRRQEARSLRENIISRELELKDLTGPQALLLLKATDKSGNRFVDSVDPVYFDKIVFLCEKAYRDSASYEELKALLIGGEDGKSMLYLAAQRNNAPLVTFLRSYFDANVNHAGPNHNMSALTAAAKAGANEAVVKLMESSPWTRFSENINRNRKDREGKTALHYLARTGDAKAFYSVIAGFSRGLLPVSPSSYHFTSTVLDKAGNTPLFYLIESAPQSGAQRNFSKEKLQYLLDNAPYSLFSSWKLDHFFDLKTVRANGYTDLEWAYKVNPELAGYMAENISDKDLVRLAKKKIELENNISGNVLIDSQIQHVYNPNHFTYVEGINTYSDNHDMDVATKALESVSQMATFSQPLTASRKTQALIESVESSSKSRSRIS